MLTYYRTSVWGSGGAVRDCNQLNTPRLNLLCVINTKGPFLKLVFGQLVPGDCTNMAIKHVRGRERRDKWWAHHLPVIQYLCGDASILHKSGLYISELDNFFQGCS